MKINVTIRCVMSGILIVLGSNVMAATQKDPERCIDKVDVYVNDQTDTFFSTVIIRKLQSQLEEIDSMQELELNR